MKKNKNSSMKKSLTIIMIMITVSSLIILGEYYVYSKYMNKNGKNQVTIPSVEKLIKEKEEKNYQDKNENQKNVINYVNNLPNYRNQYNNPYIMGRLEIPNLNIDSLVTRAQDNAFYLNNNIYNEYDGLGVPFFDYRNTDLANNNQINIYGHNTQNEKYFDQLPFINLEAYTDENIFKNYKDIYLSIDEKQIHYEVIAIKLVNNGNNEHMKIAFYNENDYLKHLGKLLQDTMYRDSNLEITSKDKIIVLQVCHYNPPNTYLLVIGKEK